jgi:SCY1-like protein 2
LAPLIFNLLDLPQAHVLQKVLRSLPNIGEVIEYSIMRHQLLPKVAQLYVTSNNVSVRVNVLGCLMAMLKHMDKTMFTERLLPMLKENRARHPAIYLAIVGIYDELGRKHLDKELIATEVIPDLWSLAVDSVFNVDQFKKTMTTIRELSENVEKEHEKYVVIASLFHRLIICF